MSKLWLAALVILLSLQPVSAQTPKDLAKQLKTDLAHQKLFLRGLSAGITIQYKWDGHAFEAKQPIARMLAVFEVGGVSIKGDKLEISGSRHALTRTSDGIKPLSPPDAVTLDIDLNGANVADVLPRLREMLFFRDEAEARGSLPPSLQDLPFAPKDWKAEAPDKSAPREDCSTANPLAQHKGTLIGQEPPKSLKNVHAGPTDEARP